MLTEYDYTIQTSERKNNKSAGEVNRLRLPETEIVVCTPCEVMFVSNSANWYVTSKTAVKQTAENPFTKRLLKWVLY